MWKYSAFVGLLICDLTEIFPNRNKHVENTAINPFTPLSSVRCTVPTSVQVIGNSRRSAEQNCTQVGQEMWKSAGGHSLTSLSRLSRNLRFLTSFGKEFSCRILWISDRRLSRWYYVTDRQGLHRMRSVFFVKNAWEAWQFSSNKIVTLCEV
jgi:predicted deacetylase